MKPSFLIIIISLAILYAGCGDQANKKGHQTSAFSDCRYGSPLAIFESGLPDIGVHSFELTSKAGIEKVTFRNGNKLEIIQTGCNEIRQEYRFEIPGNFQDQPNAYWVEEASRQLAAIGGLHEKYQPYLHWSNYLSIRSSEIKLGEPIELEKGFFITVDRILSSNYVTLLIVLSTS